MEIKNVKYLQSVVDWKKCPAATLPEFAFIGRSNVGKSSLINMLANNRSLAKTSSKPGKTQTINHFLVDNRWYLVDLPGYGYAHISKTMREKWSKMILDYIQKRENLQMLFILVDSRIEPQKIDLEFIDKMGELMIPFAIIFTKADKISALKTIQNVERYKKTLLQSWEELPLMIVSSSLNRKGKEHILELIENINAQYFEENAVL